MIVSELVLVVALPLVGALFALVMPSADRLALRYVGMGTSLGTALVAAHVAWWAWSAPVSASFGPVAVALDALSAPLLLSLVIATPVALRSGAPRIFERTQFYVVTVLFAEGLLAAALLVDSVFLRLAIATIAAVPLFALVALFGGPLRGTTTMRAAMIWLLVDVCALAVVTWLAARAHVDAPRATLADLAAAAAALPARTQVWVFFALAGPGLVRLAAGPFSVWLAAFLEEAPVSAVVLASCGAAPFGAHLLVRLALPVCPQGLLSVLPWVAGVGALSVVLSGVIAIAERDLRRLLAQLLQASGATAALALLCLGDEALAAGTMHVVATGAAATLALATTEATERRFETRDAVDLAGLSQASPLLATLLIIGLFALVGIPALGAGSTLWATVAAMARAPGLSAAGLPPLAGAWVAGSIIVGTFLATVGVGSAARRLLQPAPLRTRRDFDDLTPMQAARLFVPAVVALAVGLSAGSILAAANGVARGIAAAARAQAGIVDEPVRAPPAPRPDDSSSEEPPP